MLRIVLRFLYCQILTVLSRLRRGPLLPTWSLGFEGVVRFLQRDWEHLARLPIDRLRKELDLHLVPQHVVRRVRRLDVVAGGVPAQWFVPPGTIEGPVLFYLHGGGYVCGSTSTHADLLARLALATKARTLAIDYRLAPEHPYPAQLEDALASYRWLLEQGIDAGDIVVGGESAGGNLALRLLQELRDSGTPLPARAFLMSPWCDLTGSRPSVVQNAPFDHGSRSMLLDHARMFAGGLALDDPRISPLSSDLSGLPPLLVQVGGVERLHDECVELACRASACRTEVTLDVLPEMPHLAQILAEYSSVGRQAIDRIAVFFDGHRREASGSVAIPSDGDTSSRDASITASHVAHRVAAVDDRGPAAT